VRQALAHGLDRRLLVQDTNGAPAYGGFLPPAMPGHSHDLALRYDIRRARTLLAEAGYPDGRGLPELRLIHADPGFGADFRRHEEAKWTPQWRELGVRVRQEWVSFDDVPAEVRVGPSILAWGWVGDFPDPDGMLSTFAASHAITPHLGVSMLLEQAHSSRDRDARLNLYRTADRIIVSERTWVVPTIYDRWGITYRPHVEGIWAHPLGMGALDDVVVHRR